MKKVLFASTALIATAGMAAADVSFDGYGRFGLYYQENPTPGADETRVEQRFRLTVTGQTTSDNGLEFEGRIRFQTDENAAGASSTADTSAAGFAVSTGGFRLDVGHVSDVLDSGDVFSYYGAEPGLTNFVGQYSSFGVGYANGFGTSETFNTVAPTVKLRYSMGDFTVSASYTDDAVTRSTVAPAAGAVTTTAGGGNSEFQIGAGYSFGAYNVGLIYGSNENGIAAGVDNDFWALGFGGEIGALSFTILVLDDDQVGFDTGYGFSVAYDIGAVTQIQFAYSSDRTNAVGADDAYGIGFSHGLGGGVTLRGGIGNSAAGNTTADLGVIFAF